MRFCPFCAQENADAASECAHCGRKLPQLAGTTTVMPARPMPPPPPRRVARPMPRTRPVAPLPAASKPEPAPPTSISGPAPAAPMEAHGSARARSGTLLGIPPATPPPPPSPFDMATEVSLGPVPEPLMGDVTSPSERLDVGAPDAYDAPTDLQVSLPPAHAKPVPAKPLPKPAPSTRSSMPPVPLPPPPMAGNPRMPIDPATGEAPMPVVTAPAPMPPPAPVLPAAPPASILETTLDVPEPEPMPSHPTAGIVPAVRYLLPLARAVWARHRAQKQLRTLLHEDQRRVDEALRDLGEAAWQMRPRPPELRAELDRADDEDARRKGADQELARLDMSVAAEKERFSADEQKRKDDLARREGEVARLGEDLAERKRAQKTEEKVLRELEGRQRAVQKLVQKHEAAAQKAETTPPEKGGGPNAVANAREQAAIAQREVDAMKPGVDAQGEKVRALDEPIAQLDVSLTGERNGLATAKTELEAARRAHQDELGKLELARTQQEDTKKVAERAVRLRLVSTGTLLSLHRLDGADHKATFAPIYARLDELQGVASARDARIGALEAERHGYDKAAVQRGLIALGGAIGAFAILLVVLIVVLARSH